MTQKLTIQDIANLAGVAKSTVSRYLNKWLRKQGKSYVN